MFARIKKLLRSEKLPHIWCPGCGHGIVLQSFLRAVLRTGIDQDKFVIVSGIGCSSRAVGYLDFDTLHTAHGRALPFATGIKMAKPDLNVVILSGDGDITAIGGNHFIHAARRNIDLTTVVFNNFNYGMTGGQYSPTTPLGGNATTSPYGNVEKPFDICSMAIAAGATYAARSTTFHALHLAKLVADGIRHHGFSVIEVITGCPTCYGKLNKMGGAVKMLEWQRDNFINLKQYENLSEDEREGKQAIGLIYSKQEPEYIDEYLKITKKAQI